MPLKVQKKSRQSPKSSQPYKWRTEADMFKIIREIHENSLPKRAAYLKYGINRNTLHLFISKQSIKEIAGIHSLDLLSTMNDNQQHVALTKKIMELFSAFEKSALKVVTLETMILVAEEDPKIKTRKKSGTK